LNIGQVNVFDVFLASMPYEQARKIISELRSSHFNPGATDAFLNHFDQFVDIAEVYHGDMI
jgi:response regulator RpfG family c-di-GMP phosphodiesterase